MLPVENIIQDLARQLEDAYDNLSDTGYTMYYQEIHDIKRELYHYGAVAQGYMPALQEQFRKYVTLKQKAGLEYSIFSYGMGIHNDH